MARITKRQALATLAEVVKENGPETVTECVYSVAVIPGKREPNCIVGHVASRLTPEFFEGYVASSNAPISPIISPTPAYTQWMDKWRELYTPGAIKVLSVAQDVQDESQYQVIADDRSWGTALKEARKV